MEQKFLEAILGLAPQVHDLLLRVDPRYYGNIEEVRLRAGRPLALNISGCSMFVLSNGELSPGPNAGCYTVSAAEVESSLHTLSQYSLHTYAAEMCRGYIPLPGGHRAGLCGSAVIKNGEVASVHEVSGINLRVAREVRGCAQPLLEQAFADGVTGLLIAGPPGSGKTTMLRDLARLLSDGAMGSSYRVAVVDERGEIAAMYGSLPCCDVGANTDVLHGYPKAEGIMIAIRALGPQVVICDEVGSPAEVAAVCSCLHSGVTVITSVHAGSADELRHRPQGRALLGSGAFGAVAFLDRAAPGGVGCMYKILQGGELDEAYWRGTAGGGVYYSGAGRVRAAAAEL